MRNSWLRHSSRPLAWWRFTRTGLLALLLCSFIFLLSLSPVSARELLQVTNTPQPPDTPTPTYAPLWPSATPEPTQDLSCPGVQPEGWGTVTPDPYWYLTCSECITPQFETTTPEPVSTFVWNMTQTAQAMATGTPTPAATVTAQPTVPVGFTLTYTGDSGGCTSGPYVTCSRSVSCAQDGMGGYICDITYLFGDDMTNMGSNFTLNLNWTTGVFDTPVSLYYRLTGFGVFTSYSNADIVDMQFSGSPDITIQGDSGVWNLPAQPEPYQAFYLKFSRVTGASELFVGSASMRLELSPLPIGVPTPTPEPTPISSYCASVDAEGDEDLSDYFDIPTVRIGQAQCFGIDAVNIPLGWLGFDDVYIPGVQVCLIPVFFGKLVAWGMEIDLDYIGYVAAGAMVLRMILRS